MSTALKIVINGREIAFTRGQTILEVCRDQEIYIPPLCHDERLRPYGGCRLCLVEVKGRPAPLTSCTTPAEDGMVITTESPKLGRLRKTVLELLLSNHPNDCMCCEAAGNCSLQEMAYMYDARLDRFQGEQWNFPIREDNPFITFEPNKCIVCGRCTRICNEVVMASTIDMVNRGFNAMPGTAFDKPRTLENCEFCGQCVSASPTGALTDRKGRGIGRLGDVRRAAGILEVVPEERVEISFEDAKDLGIENKDWVKVSSRRGEVKVRARVTESSQAGNIFMTFHHQDALTNILTSEHRDPIAGTPGYKACAVRLEKAA